MDAETKQVLAKSLLLTKKAREELIEALDESIRELPIDLSDADLSDMRAILDDLIDEADEAGQRRRRHDWDVPELWRSHYYLRQGYHLDATGRGRYDHWQGGDPIHKRAVCRSCGERVHLLWDIDCNDPRFRKESPRVFGKLDRLPLYYCLHCPYPTVYRCTGNHRLQMFTPGEANSDEGAFSDFPDLFPRRRIVFKKIPPDIENLILICQWIGDDWLRWKHRRVLSEYLGGGSRRVVGIQIRRSQFGGLPTLEQGNPELVCPYEKCPTHTWGHPLVRNRRYYQMKLLATIDSDAGLLMESHAAQIVFHICWACQTVHGDFQID